MPLDISKIPTTKYVVMGEGEDAAGRRDLSWEWIDAKEEYLRYMQVIDALEIKVLTEVEDEESEDLEFSWHIIHFD